MALGFAGLMKNRKWGLVTGGLIGCLARFCIHSLSGITIYATYMPDEFLGFLMKNILVYSLLYNSTYMLPNTIIVIVIGAVISVPLKKYVERQDFS